MYGRTHILQNPDLAQDPRDLRVVLALQLVEHRIAVLPLLVRRRGAEGAVAAVRAEGAVAGRARAAGVAVAGAAGARVGAR